MLGAVFFLFKIFKTLITNLKKKNMLHIVQKITRAHRNFLSPVYEYRQQKKLL